MIKKDIVIDGRPVPFRASAAIPRIYRAKFNRDIFKDMLELGASVKKGSKDDMKIGDLEMFENVAYVMAKHADPSQPDTPEEWLDQFDTFSIYIVLPQLLELWNLNTRTNVDAKKNETEQPGDEHSPVYAEGGADRDIDTGSGTFVDRTSA